MQTKEETLQSVGMLASRGMVTKDEVVGAYDRGAAGKTADGAFSKKATAADILYYIGGGIVFLGIAILIAQNWQTIGFGAKLLATLGSGIAAYAAAFFFSRDERTQSVGSAFFLLSALVLPIGFGVLFDHAGYDVGTSAVQSWIAGILFAAFLSSALLLRKNIFHLFSVIFGTWLYFALASYLFGSSADWAKHMEYLTLALGLAYGFIGYAFSSTDKAPLSRYLYGFGILAFLGAAFALGGWSPDQNAFWEMAFPILAFGALFGSIPLKSRAFLAVGTLGLMAFIFKITSEYFSGSLGWPLALVIAGLLMIAAGYFSISIRKNYLKA